MPNCYTGTDVPTLQEEECGGVYTSDACIVHAAAITYLNLPANSSVNTIVNALVLALMYKEEQITALSDRITILETP
jgi:hypothetical protein